MDVLIISNYWHFECEKASSRYLTIANMASNLKIDVEVVTSTFYHTTKKQRDIDDQLSKYKYKTTLISEPGYKKNIDLKRICSHRRFAKNVISYLEKRKKPDLIYLFVPPIYLADRVITYANANNIKVMIDVLDLWPEAYNMILPMPQITHYLLEPMRRKANKIYAGADKIVAVSQTYVDRAMKYNNKCKKGLAVYIGTDMIVFDKYAQVEKNKKINDEIVIAYIGMLGTSYDLISVIDAISELETDIKNKVKFKVMGDGPKREEFELYAKKKNINYIFTGKLPYDEMVQNLCQCDIAVNPIKSSSASSIINKVADYAAAGLPVINTQTNPEYRNLLNEFNAGFNVDVKSTKEFAMYINRLVKDEQLRSEMGKNSRVLFEEKFSREKSYPMIMEAMLYD